MTTLNLKLEEEILFWNWDHAYCRSQILGQAKFWRQAKTILWTNFAAKIEARSTLRPGQLGQARFYSLPKKGDKL